MDTAVCYSSILESKAGNGFGILVEAFMFISRS